MAITHEYNGAQIPDPIERGEARAERWADEHVQGDKFLCSCGKWCRLDQGAALSVDPYAELFCPSCVEEYYDTLDAKEE